MKRSITKIKAILSLFIDDDLAGLAAQTAYFLLLAMFPISLFFVRLVSELPGDWDPHALESFGPMFRFLSDMPQPVVPAGPFYAVTLLSGAWAASLGVWALLKGVYRIVTRSRTGLPLHGRLFAALLTVAFILALAAPWRIGPAFLRNITRFGGVFLFAYSIYYLCQRFSVKHSKKALLYASAFTSLGWLFVTWLFERYLQNFARYTTVYGGIGAVLALALWFQLISYVTLFGALIVRHYRGDS